MLTDSENKQYVFMCTLVLKSYSVYESAGMMDLGAHDESIYSVYKLAGIRESGYLRTPCLDSNCNFLGVVTELGTYDESIYSIIELAGMSMSGYLRTL